MIKTYGHDEVGARRRSHDRFFLAMSIALLLLVLIGFARTFYLRAYFDVPDIVPPIYPYLFLHGAVLTTWFVWLIVQTSVVARGRTDIHRRLGVVGAWIAVAVVVTAGTATLGVVPRMVASGWGVAANLLRFSAVVWINLNVIMSFALFVSIAFAFRRRSEIHKRLMLLASIYAVTPALARVGDIPALLLTGSTETNEQLFLIGGLLTLLFALVVYDVVALRRVHRVTWVVVLWTFVSTGVFGFLVPASKFGQSVALWLSGQQMP
jgi:hypothetical protein